MAMKLSFKISKKGTRFQPKPKPKPETSNVVEEDDDVDAPPQIPKNQSLATTRKLSVDAEKGRNNAGISAAQLSFFVSLFPDGYAIRPYENEVGQQTAVQDDSKFMLPYDRTAETLFLAIECGQLPADLLDDIPLKYFDGAVYCEVRDYRECTPEPGGKASPKISRVRLKMTLENVVKDISLMSDSSWTYGDLMEAEARILLALHPKLDLDPTPNLDRLCEDPTVINLNLDISGMRQKRLRQMSEAATASDNVIQGKKVCMDRVPENSNCRPGDNGPIVQLSDIVNASSQNIGPSNMLASRARTFSPDTSVPAHQSKYQIGVGNPRVMQDHGSGPVFSASPGQDVLNAYTDNINSSVHGKRENQDGQLSPMASLNKRARPNSMGLDGNQQQQIASHNGFNAPADTHWKNTLMQQQQQPIGRGIQYPNAGMQQKYPHQMFEGSFNQEGGAMPFTMGQPGMRYNLKQEPVESDKVELNRSKNEMNMADSETNHDSQQLRLQQRLPQQQQQQFTRSNFPQTTWNNLGQPLENNSRKEEQFQRRKSAQSPRVSAGGLPQSPLSSKSGEFSSGSLGGTQFGVAALGSSQREKSAVTSVPAVGSLTSSANDSMQRQHQAQMAVNRRSNSLPKTPAMTGVGSPASGSNMSGPFNAGSPVGKEADKSLRDRFSKIEMLTARYQLNRKNKKIDEYQKITAFPTQQLAHCLFSDHNNDNLKDETCKMPLSKSVVGGSMNICKTRVLGFRQNERVIQGNGFSIVTKSRTRLILSEKPNEGTVAMHYGEWDDCDYLAEEECLPTLPNTHVADLLAAQFCSLILREGYDIEADHLQPKKVNTGGSGSQPPAEMQQTQEAVSGQPSNEAAKPSNSGTSSVPNSMAGARMHPPSNSQAMQISQGGLLPGVSRPHQSEPSLQQQQQQHSMMQQQLQRSPAMMLGSNPLSHINAMGQNSNMQQQFGHMLNKVSPLQLQLLQQQQPQMQRKMMMGLGNNMVGLQGLGNVMGMTGARGISPPMAGSLSPMNNNMNQNQNLNQNQNQNQNQNPMNVSQASNISNVISQQFRSGQYTPVQAAIMATKLRMAQSRTNMMGGAGGSSSNISGLPGATRQIHPVSSGLSMLGPSVNRANNMNPMQRTAMAPPKLTSGMNLYMNQQQQQLHLQQQMQQQQQLQQQHQQQQQQETTSPLQAVLSPPQQVGSPSMGMASPQQMSQRTPMSPQLSSGAIHPPMSAGNQEGNCPSPQLSSQTMGSVSSIANSPMDLQGVNKSG